MPNGFTTLYRPGPAWVPGRALTEQPGWDENLEYWSRLKTEHGFDVVGSPVNQEELLFAVWERGELEQVSRLAAEAPLIVSGVLVSETRTGRMTPC